MKKALTILMILSQLSTFAQDSKKLSYQFNLGTSLSIPDQSTASYNILIPVTGTFKTDYQSSFGYFSELIVNYGFNDKFSLSTGLNYTYSSLSIVNEEGSTRNEGHISSSYLNIPLMVGYQLSEKIPLTVSGGAYLGVFLNAREYGIQYLDTAGLIFYDPNDPFIIPEQEYDHNINEDYLSTDFGVLLQLDYQKELNEKLILVFMTRFNYGLKNVLVDDYQIRETKYSAAKEWENHNLLIGVGIKIR
jgi:hypothetical protein